MCEYDAWPMLRRRTAWSFRRPPGLVRNAATCRLVLAGLVGLVSAVLPATAFAQATTISPAQGAVLTAPSGITFSWTLPSDETAADLWYSDIDDIGPPFPGVAPPFGDVEVPLAPDQTSYVLTSRLARGVVYYWEISDYCVPDTTCAFNNGDVFPTVSDQSSFGVTNPLTYPMALEDLKLAILEAPRVIVGESALRPGWVCWAG